MTGLELYGALFCFGILPHLLGGIRLTTPSMHQTLENVSAGATDHFSR